MGTFKEVYGDIIELSQKGEFDIIGHGCNCQKNFGGGLALTMKNKYPLSYEVDKLSEPKLGE